MNKFCTVMGFEATNNTLVIGVDVCSQVWFKVFDMNICESIWNDVSREIVLQEEDFSSLISELGIPIQQPLLIECSRHPCFCIVSIVEAKLRPCLVLEGTRLVC